MRAKELKNFLNKIPDDTEILLRCQNHEIVSASVKETVGIVSVTPHINEVTHQVILNADKSIRLCSFMPDLSTLVVCDNCVRGDRIKACKQRGKACEDCQAVCDCKNCNNYNIDVPQPFSIRNKYEEGKKKKK